MTQMPCSPWATIDDISGKCKDIAIEYPDVVQKAIDIAQATVFRLTMGIFTGSCSTTIRPAKSNCVCRNGVDLSTYTWIPSGFPYRAMAYNGSIYNCPACDCFDSNCGTSDCITLPFYPVNEITNITIDGSILPSNKYELRGVKICRTDGLTFPTCQDLDIPLGQSGSWSVTFKHGIAPPVDLVEHMLDYACQLAKRKLDRPCELPKRVAIEKDFVALDPMTFVKDGLTGWAPLDACIRSINPKGAKRPARAINPVKRRSLGKIS